MLTTLCIYAFGMDVTIQIISLYGIHWYSVLCGTNRIITQNKDQINFNRLRMVSHQNESESDRVVMNIVLFCIDYK
jgi:hypothetical protein